MLKHSTFYAMIGYANIFMIKLMNINLNVMNERKMAIIVRGSTYKTSYIVVASNFILPHRILGTELKLRHCILVISPLCDLIKYANLLI